MIARIWPGRRPARRRRRLRRLHPRHRLHRVRRDLGESRRLDASPGPGRPDRVHHLVAVDSLDAIHAFAGDDIEAAVLYPEDARYLVSESTVTHYQVVD